MAEMRKIILPIICVIVILCACGNATISESESVQITDEIQNESIIESETGNNQSGNDVLKYYTIATSLTKDQLTKNSLGIYEYNGISFLSEDCDIIEKYGTVEAGAFYRKMAKFLEGFSSGLIFQGWQNNAKHIVGFVPESKDEFASYVEDLTSFIINSGNSQDIVMKKLKTLNSVNGKFDFENKQYEFTIENLSLCAKEINISDEMLGYILAMLEEYAPDSKFDGDSYSFKSNEFFYKKPIDNLSADDFVVSMPNDDENMDTLQYMQENYGEEGGYQYFYYDASIDSNKKGVVVTNREICIGSSKEDVFDKYGHTEELMSFDTKTNLLYQLFDEYDAVTAGIMRTQCISYVNYKYEDIGSIEFYFDDHDEVSWVVFYYGI